MNKKFKYILGAAALWISASANATLIDFTDRAQWEADGTPSTVTYGDLTVTVTAYDNNGVETSFNARQDFDGVRPCELPGIGTLVCDSDGLGIGDDEITFGDGGRNSVERIKVSFSRAVSLSAVAFLDLFAQGSPTDNPTEVAQSTSSNGGSNVWDATASNTTGFFVATADNGRKVNSLGGFTNITSIDFFADTAGTSSPSNTDFALAAIVIDVPAPNAVFIMLSAFGALYLRRRLNK